MQILAGVYLVNGSPYGRHQNGYLVHSEGATVLIDSGNLHDAETLPEVERNAMRFSFSSLRRMGGQSGVGNSSDLKAGIQ